jgi:predicted DNA-binding transcriptional regulator AlpA
MKTTTDKKSTAPEVRHHIDRRADQVADILSSGDPDEALDTNQTARLLGVSTQWLEICRHRGEGPTFTRLSPRMIRYVRRDVVAWLKARAHACTSEYADRARKSA